VAQLREIPPIVRLDLAEVELPASHPAASCGRVLVYGFCVVHPDGPILVDTGVGFGNEFIDELYRPERAVLADVLKRSGIKLESVVAVVNSHLHFDHCGQNPALFEGPTEFFAQAVELEQVQRDGYYTVPAWALAPEQQRRVVLGDEVIADGVTLIATPGHTSGHQSVLVEGGGRRVVIGAQVVWHSEEFRAEVASAANVDKDHELQVAAVDSIRRIKAFRPEVLYFSHCSELELTALSSDAGDLT
jgi:N-acyl homoserine lactone hydrolase